MLKVFLLKLKNSMVRHLDIMSSNAIVSPKHSSSKMRNVLKDKEVNLIDGSRIFGSVIGNVDSSRQYIDDQMLDCLEILRKLAKHAKCLQMLDEFCAT